LDDRDAALAHGDAHDDILGEHDLAALAVHAQLRHLLDGAPDQVIPAQLVVSSSQQVGEPAHRELS
jgi:hypothetical protein